MTTQMVLTNPRVQTELANGLLIVDESGFLSTKQMEEIFKLAREKNTRVLFVGDTKQHTSVEAGDALRLLERYSPILTAEILDVRRQKDLIYKKAVVALSKGKVGLGMRHLRDMGVLKQATHLERPSLVASEYVDHVEKNETVLIVTPTWKEHGLVTDQVREKLRGKGLIESNDTYLEVYRSANFKEAEKKYAPDFRQSINSPSPFFVSFHKDTEGFRQGEIFEVKSADGEEVMLKDGSGAEKRLNVKKSFKAFDVVIKESRPFSKGDLILLKANYATSPENRLSNGSIQKIESVNHDGTLHLQGGKTLGKDFRMFTHGYATTSPGSQGKDADFVIVSSNSKAINSLSKNQLYVSVSRGKKGLSVYTDSLARFSSEVEKSAARKLVSEKLLESVLKLNIRTFPDQILSRSRDLIQRAYRKFKGKDFYRQHVETSVKH